MEEKSVYETPSGLMNLELTARDGILVSVSFTDKAPTPTLKGTEAAAAWLDVYFTKGDPGFLPVCRVEKVSVFCKRVLALLADIPYGKTVTYGNLAKRYCERYGVKRMSARAIGGAVGRNPLAVMIPCHRVIGADGSLTGYAGGPDNKKFLLKREGIV